MKSQRISTQMPNPDARVARPHRGGGDLVTVHHLICRTFNTFGSNPLKLRTAHGLLFPPG